MNPLIKSNTRTMCSRSLGDYVYQRVGVTHRPKTEHVCVQGDAYVLLASGIIMDSLTGQSVFDIVNDAHLHSLETRLQRLSSASAASLNAFTAPPMSLMLLEVPCGAEVVF